MEKIYAVMTTTRLEKKEGTKTVFTASPSTTENITESQYNNIIESKKFFQSLGGIERDIKTYTKRGYKVTRITSTSPDRKTKVVREFDLDINI